MLQYVEDALEQAARNCIWRMKVSMSLGLCGRHEALSSACALLLQAQRASERGAEADVLAAKQALLEAQQELQNATRERDALLATTSQVKPSS